MARTKKITTRNPVGRRYSPDEYRQWFLDDLAEQEGFEGEVEITKKLDREWDKYEKELGKALEEWVKVNQVSDEKLDEMRDEDPEYNVFSTLAGEGVGIWDGRWDHILTEDQIEDLTEHLERRLGKYVDQTGAGTINDEMRGAVWLAEKKTKKKRRNPGRQQGLARRIANP